MATRTKKKVKGKLAEACDKVWRAFLAYGPVEGGGMTEEAGEAFDSALMEMRLAYKAFVFQTSAERMALVEICNAASSVGGDPIHYKVREAINKAQEVLSETDLIIDE